jgi:hypothetical protein
MTKLLTAYLNSPGGRSYRSKGTRRRTCYAAVSAGHHFRKPPRREIRPRLSAVLRRSPAFLSASLRCTPGDILRASSSASTAISFRLRVSLCDSSAEVTIWAWSHLLQSNMLTSRPDGLRTTPARFIVESHFGQCKLPAPRIAWSMVASWCVTTMGSRPPRRASILQHLSSCPALSPPESLRCTSILSTNGGKLGQPQAIASKISRN